MDPDDLLDDDSAHGNTSTSSAAYDSTIEPLDEDYEPPAAPPYDGANLLPPDHPLTDTALDAHEIYDEGIDGATDVDAHDEARHVGLDGTIERL